VRAERALQQRRRARQPIRHAAPAGCARPWQGRRGRPPPRVLGHQPDGDDLGGEMCLQQVGRAVGGDRLDELGPAGVLPGERASATRSGAVWSVQRDRRQGPLLVPRRRITAIRVNRGHRPLAAQTGDSSVRSALPGASGCLGRLGHSDFDGVGQLRAANLAERTLDQAAARTAARRSTSARAAASSGPATTNGAQPNASHMRVE